MDNRPLMVSIHCLVYNHEPFLRQCLDGFVMQKTNFRFEAVVHDDASTDGSAAIIREYAEKYPDIIKPIFETENQWSKKDGSLDRIMNEACVGKYIAFCEGDDYWTDPLKLQKQVSLLEAYPEIVLCTHKYSLFDQNSASIVSTLPDFPECHAKLEFDLNYYVSCKWVTQPLTAVYRKDAFDLATYLSYGEVKDVSLFYNILKSGSGCLLPDVMGVYRQHNCGVWSGVKEPERYRIEIECRLGIYDVEKNEVSAKYLHNSLLWNGYLGVTFFKKNLFLYIRALRVVGRYFGFKQAVRTFRQSVDFTKR